ncbi:MAG: nitronate monooxygenase, partial [Candidatus Omnitrophota bacterium]
PILKKVSAIELNLSCPNIKHGKRDHLIAQDEEATRLVVKSVRDNTALPIIAKLTPNITDITKIAKAAEAAGADAVSLINTFYGIAVDIETRKPKLGNITGGLSGPAIKPLAVRFVYEAHKVIDIPIIGIGGIMDYKDAIEFMLCGAAAVQVGTANFVNPAACIDIVKGIKAYSEKNGLKSMADIIGKLKI